MRLMATAKTLYSGLNPGTTKFIMEGIKKYITPQTKIIPTDTTYKKARAKSHASFLLRVKCEMKTGINAEDTAPPIMTLYTKSGIRNPAK